VLDPNGLLKVQRGGCRLMAGGSMILVVNCLIEEAFAADFNRVLTRDLERLGRTCRCLRSAEIGALPDDSDFTHLILSGSEASATFDQPWDGALERLVRGFVDSGRPVLGICYGHQFLAKILAGPECVRRAKTPEFGWLEPRLGKSALFHGLVAPRFMVCHYDEVFDLPAEFRVLADSEQCAVHAFQYRDLPVWGVQFHPEYGPGEAGPIFRAVCRSSPELIPSPPEDLQGLDQRFRIFENFLRAKKVD
jgi:GMP synthase-like glutamine amidotransferase